MRQLGGAVFAGLLICASAGAQTGREGAGADGELVVAAAAPALDASTDLAPCSDTLTAPSPGEETPAPSPPTIWTIALKDTFSILGAPLHWDGHDWLVFGGIAAGVTAVGFAFDIPMRNKTQAHQTSTLDDLTKVVEPFGAEYSWAVIGAYGIAGYLFHDTEAKDIFFDSAIASILASGIITPTLKFVVGRERPSESVSSTSFHPFSGSDNSFPSGHATQAFAVASVISAHSDQVWVSVTAYTIAGLVGFARIYHNAHWTSDVTAGALIGTFVGRGVVALNKKLRAGNTTVRIAFAPIIGPDVKGAGFLVAF
jgi:membrane-associated phospholipid phosphatase